MDVAKIGKNMVKSVATGDLCRGYSRKLSTLKPQFDANNVRHVGIGLEELGVQEFIDGKFFDGELFLDLKKACYQDMGFKRLGCCAGIASIFKRSTKVASAEADKQGIKGNMKGDGFQNGGTIIVQPSGKVLLNYVQQNPADHVALEDVLTALSIDGGVPGPSPADGANAT